MPRPSLFTVEQQQIISSGIYSIPELSKMFNRPHSSIWSHAKKHGIKLEKPLVKGPCIQDHDLFKVWSPNTSYLVGFLLGDGYLCAPNNKTFRSYKIEITLARKDEEFLYKLRDLFGSTHKIFRYNSNCPNEKHLNSHPSIRLTMNSKVIFEDLVNIGVTPKKKYTAKWIDQCPEEFVSHMVRGFCDADGCITNSETKNRPQSTLAVTFSGTESNMLGVQKSFSKIYGIEVGTVYHADDGPYYYYTLSGNRVAIAFCEWIYKDSTEENRLERKYQVYKKFYDNYVNNPRTHLHTNRNNAVSMDHPHNFPKEVG